jgi:hypothetical protein
MNSLSEQVHDGIVQKFELDFQTKCTTILLERWFDEAKPERISVQFIGVALQDFKDFNTFNLFSDINEATNAKEFWGWYSEWLERNKNYQSAGVLENIAADTSLRYFSIEASSGFDGFVICKDLLIVTQE